MFSIKNIHWIAVMLTLIGCDSEVQLKTIDEVVSQGKTIGVYQNGAAYLILDGENGVITNKGMRTEKKYDITGNKLFLHMPNSSIENRSDLELVITRDGKELLCPSCGSSGLGMIWKRVKEAPDMASLEKIYE